MIVSILLLVYRKCKEIMSPRYDPKSEIVKGSDIWTTYRAEIMNF